MQVPNSHARLACQQPRRSVGSLTHVHAWSISTPHLLSAPSLTCTPGQQAPRASCRPLTCVHARPISTQCALSAPSLTCTPSPPAPRTNRRSLSSLTCTPGPPAPPAARLAGRSCRWRTASTGCAGPTHMHNSGLRSAVSSRHTGACRAHTHIHTHLAEGTPCAALGRAGVPGVRQRAALCCRRAKRPVRWRRLLCSFPSALHCTGARGAGGARAEQDPCNVGPGMWPSYLGDLGIQWAMQQ